MTIDFYYMPASAPCRAVEMVFSLLGVKVNKHLINLMAQEQLKEDYIKLNPLHKVPFIVDGNLKLNESRAIMAYLVNKYKPDDQHLYPKDPERRAKVDELLYYDIGTLYNAGAKLLYPKFFKKTESFNPEDEQALRNILDYMNNELLGEKAKGHKFMLGDHLTIADVSLVATFSFITSGLQIDEHKNLVAYLNRVRDAIPNYSEINDKACAALKKVFGAKENE